MRFFRPPIGLILVFLSVLVNAQSNKVSQYQTENQPASDLGNGYYRNPVIPGKYGDPSIIREDSAYYMIHSGGVEYAFLMWKSYDLVNWAPVTKIATGNLGKPWAPDLIKVDDRYYIYVTQTQYHEDGSRSFANYVYHADKPEGPWSNPINLNIKGLIDPGHLTAKDGKRYLYFEKGFVTELSSDGLSPVGEIKKVYDGWEYPEDWVVECPCLEGPKFLFHNNYYYLVSALGGTNGPSTSHMATLARSRSPLGPWEESPFNPFVKTYSNEETWWSQGHATIIDDVDGNWWAIYHAYENENKTMGRPTLLMPVTWTNDGWPVIKPGTAVDGMNIKPAGKNIGHGLPLSDPFDNKELGFQWKTSSPNLQKFEIKNGKLEVSASGSTLKDAIKLKSSFTNKSYEIGVQVTINDNAEAGILIGDCGIGIKHGAPKVVGHNEVDLSGFTYSPVLYNNGRNQMHRPGELTPFKSNSIWLKIVNYKKDIILYYSENGTDWTKLKRSFRSENLVPSLYVFGKGKVYFDNYTYLGLD